MQKDVLPVEKWHELAEEEKEILRIWSVDHDFGLTISPSASAATCDYAALLTIEQLKLFLEEKTGEKTASTDLITSWNKVKSFLHPLQSS